MTTFSALQRNYPKENRSRLYNALGGEWPNLVDDPNYVNTCAIRMSITLHKCGIAIPTKYKEAVAGDGRALIIKVKTMWEFVNEKFGEFSWGMSKPEGAELTLPARKGIIGYHAAYSDATGHFDLWDGGTFIGQLDVWAGITLPEKPDMTDVYMAFDVSMWFID
ncbi:MAG: type VI secretion system amidase effector protein Tae4 [Shewanella sp.]|nr:type VI secretion system amidase effector protein Tae4 [Shewanella sp.]